MAAVATALAPWILGSSLILILLAYLGQVEEPEGIVPGCAASALTEIPRRNRSGLTEEEFYQEHVLKGIPLLLFLDEPMPALDVFLSACADRKLNLLSKQQADVLQDLLDEELPLWQWLVSNFVLLLTTGSTARRWAQLRQATATELFEGPAAASSYEQHAFERLQNRKVPWQTLQGIEDIGLRHESDARVFYGGPKSYSYPLHRDLPDGDVLCVLHSGCKDVVMLPPAARRRLERLQVPGARRRPTETTGWRRLGASKVVGEGVRRLQKSICLPSRFGGLLLGPANRCQVVLPAAPAIHALLAESSPSLCFLRLRWTCFNALRRTLKTLRLAAEEETHLGEALAALRARRARRKR
eukprot:g4353.t1